MQLGERIRHVEQVLSDPQRALARIKISTAWRDATWVFVLSRLVILLMTYIGTGMFPLGATLAPQSKTSRLHGWYHYDAIAYTTVAHQGYTDPHYAAFFPFWPLLIHILGAPFGGSLDAYYIVGLLMANVFFFLAMVLFHQLISREFDPTIAKAALLYLAFYPYAIFFFAGYTESLFLLLALGIFLLLRSRKMRYWWLAGLLGFLATMTRSTGLVLMVPIFVVALQRYWLGAQFQLTSWWQKLHSLAPMLVVPLGLGTYMAYLGVTKGNPLLYSSVESEWHRHFELPWVGLVREISQIYHPSAPHSASNFLDLAFTLIPLIILVVGWKRLPLHYTLFGVAVAVFSLSFPSLTQEPLISVPRYMVVIFPMFIIFALWSKFPRFDRFYLTTSVALFALNVILFTSHRFVA
jgi:Mannosyltransferase (PIG-V)